jgi:hypothetical protein
MTTDRALYEKMYAAQLAEGHDLETAMRYNKAATPEDFLRAFGESSDPRHQHRKWGGGNKMGSGGAAVNAARRARAKANAASRGPGLGFHLGQMVRGIKARFNDTQGQNMSTGAEGFGYSNHSRENSYNTHGVGTRADGSEGTYGGPGISAGTYGGVSNFTSGLPSSSNLSSFNSPSSFLNNMAKGSLIAGGIPYGTPGADDPFADHDDSPLNMDDDSDFPSDLFGIGEIRASTPRMAGLFIT